MSVKILKFAAASLLAFVQFVVFMMGANEVFCNDSNDKLFVAAFWVFAVLYVMDRMVFFLKLLGW